MESRISKINAVRILVFITIFSILYHIGALLKIVPLDMVMGGKYKSYEDLKRGEIVIMISNILILIFLISTFKHFRPATSPQPKYITAISWILCVLLAINTLGNLAAENIYETLIFAPMTLASTILYYRLTRMQ